MNYTNSTKRNQCCGVCYKKQLFDCHECGAKQGNPGYCFDCRKNYASKQKQESEQVSNRMCSYYHEVKNKKVYCEKYALVNSQYCKGCRESIKMYSS